ncbi:MAG: NADH:ubiquinone reductase (Na(+)-transporting) subunit A, partial [Kistimonas sp.]|nr:NADH:ubiquinone reductase (Na(+)-transporting) subunit A [Kistimonas sp.]
MIKIKRGLSLPISGSPQQTLGRAVEPRSVALLGPDYVGMRPSMAVCVGDRVRSGDPLFTDKTHPQIKFTSPACGQVTAIHRGHKRVLQSVVVQVEGDEAADFQAWSPAELAGLSRQQVVEQLLESGLWTALRTRPFSKVPAPDAMPRSLFVTAMDTNPLTVNPELVIAEQPEAFEQGL